MTAFDTAVARVLGIEGGFTDDPQDRGGETNHGITLAVARAHGYTGPMQALPVETAKAIYRRAYWDAMRLDDVAAQAPTLAERLFDAAVNAGVGQAGRWFQRSLNAFSRRGTLYNTVAVDGAIGNKTLAAFNAFMAFRGPGGGEVLRRTVNCLQGAFYVDLAERPGTSYDKYVYGWINNRIT